MKIMKHLFFLILSFMLVFLCFPFRKARAGEVYGGIDTFYQTTETNREDGDEEETWNHTQAYSFGYRNAITRQMNYLFDFRAAKNETESQESRSYFNNGMFNVTNFLFNLNTGYQLMDRDQTNTSRISSNLWYVNLNSNIQDVPELRLQYSEGENRDHLDVHQTDNSSRQLSGGVHYDYEFMDANLNYNRQEREDFVQDTFVRSDSYSGRLELNRSFFDNKLTLKNDFTWNRNDSLLLYKSDITVLETRDINRGLYLNDNLPATDEMNIMDTLIDGDYSTATELDIGSTGTIYNNIGVELELPEECETVYLYTTSNYDPSLSNAYFTWEVYYSEDGINWNLIASNASFFYDTVYSRFEITFPSREARYFKVVNTSRDDRSFIGSVSVTEIEVLGSQNRKANEEINTTASRWGTNFVASYRPLKDLTVGYNFTCDYSESDPGPPVDSYKTREMSHGTNVSYYLNKYLSSSAQYGIRTSVADNRENKNDSVSLQFNSSPLETLNTSLSFNHTESEEEREGSGGEREKLEGESDSCLLYTSANLWEGVDVSGNYLINQNESSAGAETTAHTINLDLRTKLTKNVTVESGYGHNWERIEGIDIPAEWKQTSNIFLKLRYSPSDIFYLSSDYISSRSEEVSSDSTGFSMSWLPAEKIQINFNSKLQQNRYDQYNDETISCALDMSWYVSRYIIFKCGNNYSKSKGKRDNETQTIYARFSARI